MNTDKTSAKPSGSPSGAPERRRPQPKKRRRNVKGTATFYTVLMIFIVLFFVAMSFVMSALKDWLVNYEASQPHTKCQEIFDQIFADPNWEEIYELSGAEGSTYVNKQSYAAYMENLIGDQELNYIETSAGLSGDKKYIVRAGTEKVATFTLTAEDKDASIPDWQLGKIETFFSAELGYKIITVPGYTVTVNGVALDESCVMRTVTTKAENYLPEGVHGYRLAELHVNGLLEAPEIIVTDEQGQQVELTYDAENRTYSHEISSIALGESEEETLINVAKTYCKYMIRAVGKSDLKSCFDSSTEIYDTVATLDTWMQNYTGYDFGEATVTDYYRYSDDLYSARVSLVMNVTRNDGTVKGYEMSNTFFLKKDADGDWLVIEMINSNPQEQVTMVRLTYMEEDKVLVSELVDTESKFLTPPTVEVPEGKTFAGWFTETVDANGNKTMSLSFLPGEDGKVPLATGNLQEAMTLYALFEDKEA